MPRSSSRPRIVSSPGARPAVWRTTAAVEFEPIDSGTRVAVVIEYDPEGMKESLGALVGIDGRQVENDLERFRDLVEAREVPTGAWRGSIESGDVVAPDAPR